MKNSVKTKKTLFFYKNLPEIIVFNEKMSFAHEPTLTKDNLEKTMKKKDKITNWPKIIERSDVTDLAS